MIRIRAIVGACVIALLANLSLAQDKPGDDALKEKGLTKTGAQYLLEADAKNFDAMKAYRLAKKQMDDDTKKRTDIEAKIRMAKGALGQWELDYRNLNEKLAEASANKDAYTNNQIVGQLNSLQSKLKEGTTFLEEREAELAKLGNSRDAFVQVVMDLSGKMDEAASQYEALAKDDNVKAALAAINAKPGPKVRLGPTDNFTANLRLIRRERDGIKSDVVAISVQGHVPHVDVNFNGKLTRSLVLDSGASYIALTADLAKALDMVPGPKDEVMSMQLADGKVVEARHMVLKSVRVGSFTVENVDCAVLPESLVAADNLLGGSFLNHFVYKLDAEAGELHLAQVGAKPGTNDSKTSSGAPVKKPDAPDPKSGFGTPQDKAPAADPKPNANPLDKKPAGESKPGGNPLDLKGN